jgi:tetratricopeptide (TPR) repeat protein
VDGPTTRKAIGLRVDPVHRESLINRSIAYADAGENALALADLDHLVRLYPMFGPGWIRRGNYRVDHNLDGAKDDFEAALRLEATDSDALNGRGVLHFRRGRLDAAIADFTEAIRFAPKHSLATQNLARALTAKGELRAAMNQFGISLRLEPHNSAAQSCLARLILAVDDHNRGKAPELDLTPCAR